MDTGYYQWTDPEDWSSPDIDDFLYELMTNHLVDENDLYRIEMFLQMGYKPGTEVLDEMKNMVGYVADNFDFPSVGDFVSSLTHYSKLRETVSH